MKRFTFDLAVTVEAEDDDEAAAMVYGMIRPEFLVQLEREAGIRPKLPDPEVVSVSAAPR